MQKTWFCRWTRVLTVAANVRIFRANCLIRALTRPRAITDRDVLSSFCLFVFVTNESAIPSMTAPKYVEHRGRTWIYRPEWLRVSNRLPPRARTQAIPKNPNKLEHWHKIHRTRFATVSQETEPVPPPPEQADNAWELWVRETNGSGFNKLWRKPKRSKKNELWQSNGMYRDSCGRDFSARRSHKWLYSTRIGNHRLRDRLLIQTHGPANLLEKGTELLVCGFLVCRFDVWHVL